MKALIYGKTGQVATELACQIPAGVEAMFLARSDADQTDPAACAALVTQYAPDVVINAAAYTAVDKAEQDQDTAMAVNGLTPAALAKACAATQTPFLHVSTDYVFDGQRRQALASGGCYWAAGGLWQIETGGGRRRAGLRRASCYSAHVVGGFGPW